MRSASFGDSARVDATYGATAVLLATNGIALWALNDARPDQHIIFTDPTHTR